MFILRDPEVCKDAKQRRTGEHWEAIESVLRTLVKYTYANHITSIQDMSEDDIANTCWDKFKIVYNKTEVYNKPLYWNSLTAPMDKFHLRKGFFKGSWGCCMPIMLITSWNWTV